MGIFGVLSDMMGSFSDGGDADYYPTGVDYVTGTGGGLAPLGRSDDYDYGYKSDCNYDYDYDHDYNYDYNYNYNYD